MLLEFSIKNFAIIEQQSISFNEGLTVLTGETGAGKSIIIDAIGLLVGGRSSSEYVRHGQKKAELEGIFNFDEDNHPALQKAMEHGISVEENTLIFRREISSTGKSVCKINGQMVTLSILKEIGRKTIDIHGQHEHQVLMDQELHIALLDKYGVDVISPIHEEYINIYTAYLNVVSKLKNISTNDQLQAQRLDLLQFQIEEIASADLRDGEEEELTEERNQLNNFEKVNNRLQSAYQLLREERAVLDLLGSATNELDSISDVSLEYKSIFEVVSNCFYSLEDVASQINATLDDLEFDEERLDFVEQRLDIIGSLKRKYGNSISEILAYFQKINVEINQIVNSEEVILELQAKKTKLEQALEVAAGNLTKIRKEVATQLEALIHKELNDLYMEKAIFSVDFKSSSPSISGFDIVEFYITTNPGEPLKPLSKIASGGELSRIMLAIKGIFSKHQGITAIVFDEIDSGVSGRVAQAIAEKIYNISSGSQVLCITHLPHVAAMADNHLFISKSQNENTTQTNVTEIFDKDVINEIANMISGKNISTHTSDHVKEMIQHASEFKLRK